MRKFVCDACSKEADIKLDSDPVMTFKVHCHNVENGTRGYVGRSGEPTSGRMVHFDLCLKCFNTIERAAVAKLREIQASHATDSEAATKPATDSETSPITADAGKGGTALPKTQKRRPASRGRSHRAE